jgi:hypothetical protein
MPSRYSEDYSVEQAAIDIFKDINWDTLNAYQEELASSETLGALGRSSLY